MSKDMILWQPRYEPPPVIEPEVMDEEGPDDQARAWTSERLRLLIRNLTPYVDGTFGTVSTKHATVYLRALNELNRLWRATYVKPPPPPPEPDVEAEETARTEAAAITRSRVLDQLEELRARTRTVS